MADPLDAAAIRICDDHLARSADIDACVVPLSVAKQIRDEAVAAVLSGTGATLALATLDEIADAINGEYGPAEVDP